MLDRLTSRVEFLANIAIVVVACLLATAVVRTYLLDEARTAPPIKVNPLAEGSRLSFLNIDWKSSERTLILAISTTCHFCSESAPFYKKLIAEKGNMRLIAVLPQSILQGQAYLHQLGLSIDEIKQG